MKWAYRTARRIMHVDLDERPLSQLVPGLYQASWDFRRSNERSASKSSRASRATVRIRRPSMTRMHSEQAMDRASLDSVLDSNPPSQRGIISQASDSFIGERIHRAGTGCGPRSGTGRIAEESRQVGDDAGAATRPSEGNCQKCRGRCRGRCHIRGWPACRTRHGSV